MIDFWSYKKEYKKYKKDILKSIDNALIKGNIFFGDELLKFEKNFTKKYNYKYGLAVKSCTDALYISLKVLGVKKGDEVVFSKNSEYKMDIEGKTLMRMRNQDILAKVK